LSAGVTATVALAVTLVIGSAGAQAQGTGGTAPTAQRWDVQVSADDSTGTFMAQGFYPGPLIVRVGDTVTWRWASALAPHTVTFNGGRPDLPLVVPGPGQGELTLGPAFAPVGISSPSAAYDGTAQISSGAPEDPNATFSLTFTRPGTYGYVCSLHPGMRAEIEVREAGALLPETPAQATARGRTTAAALLDKMKADVAAYRSAHVGSIHTAVAGLGDGYGASYIQFAPRNLTVRRGDTVVWTMPDPFEIHTVTFTSGNPPPPLAEPRPQSSGQPLLVIPASVAGPAGGDVYVGQGIVNAGILGNGGAFVLRFDAPPGTYEYVCLIHPTMKASVTVMP
jgi:plastocyanin